MIAGLTADDAVVLRYVEKRLFTTHESDRDTHAKAKALLGRLIGLAEACHACWAINDAASFGLASWAYPDGCPTHGTKALAP